MKNGELHRKERAMPNAQRAWFRLQTSIPEQLRSCFLCRIGIKVQIGTGLAGGLRPSPGHLRIRFVRRG